MLKSYTISTKSTLAGAILNGNKPSLPIKFGDAVTYNYFIGLLKGLNNPANGNNLDSAFQIARTSMFSEDNGAREDVPKTLLVFVDNKVTGDVVDLGQEARALQEQGVKIVLIGTGEDVNPTDYEDIVDVYFFPEDLPSMNRIIYPVIQAVLPG